MDSLKSSDNDGFVRMVELAVRRRAVQMQLSNYELFADPQWLANRIAFELVQKIATRTQTSHTFEAPADWWSHVKTRFAPAWFLRRWPAKTRRETVDVVEHYPHILIPDNRAYISILAHRHE